MVNTARDIMETPVLSVSPQDPIDAVQRFFFDEGIHGAPVIDDERRVLGVISTTDLLRAVTDRSDSERPHVDYASDGTEEESKESIVSIAGEILVEHFMTEGVVSVDESAPVAEIVETFREYRVHRIFVLSDGLLEGVISSIDLLSLIDLKV